MTVESPPTLLDLIDTFDRVGLGDLVRGYFGEPPMLLARKGTLRRMAHGGKTGGWHQDGAFMGADIRSLNIWLALTHCGDDAPGLDLVGRRLDELVQTGEGAFADWATDPDSGRGGRGGAIERPIFDPGDVLLFDQLNLHRTTIDPGMDKDRYAIETWLFAPSTYELMTTEVADGYRPGPAAYLVLTELSGSSALTREASVRANVAVRWLRSRLTITSLMIGSHVGQRADHVIEVTEVAPSFRAVVR